MKRLYLLGASVALVALLAAAPAASASGNAKITAKAAAARLVSPAAAFTVNFDNVTAPCFFAGANHLQGKFGGAKFAGTHGNGGAIMNECANFGVSNYSPPNFLGFNCNTFTLDGVTPKLPETIKLGRTDAQTGTTFYLASGESVGKSVHILASSADGLTSGYLDYPLAAEGTVFTVNFPANTIKLSSTNRHDPVCVMVVDDLNFTR